MLFILTVAAIFMTTMNLAISHFPLFSPQWRGDSMDEEGSAWPSQSKYSLAERLTDAPEKSGTPLLSRFTN